MPSGFKIDHRKAEVGKELWRSPGPNFCGKLGYGS